MMQFSTLPLSRAMLTNLDTLGYTQMSAIQQHSLPYILQKKDVLAKAKTGSGKTAAFGIGLLHHLDVARFRVQSLVLCPTRELADQVAKELRRLAKCMHNVKILTLCGGESFGRQTHSLSHHAHIVVGTPGRVLKHLNKKTLTLDEMKILVLDEADRMLDMGFSEEVLAIIEQTPQKRQTLLFSATYDDEIIEISRAIQRDAVVVETVDEEQPNKIEELFYRCEDKFDALMALLCEHNPQRVIIFTNTKLFADVLAEKLYEHKVDALALHGDLEQYERNDVLVQFSNHSSRVLVATDVAARGIDIKNISMVINYDSAHTQEIYTHRIGRTARAGEEGVAITLCDADEAEEHQEYVAYHKEPCCEFSMEAQYRSVVIEGGKKDKLRAGDIVGAFIGEFGVKADDIGDINIYDRQVYVALKREKIPKSKAIVIKKRKFAIWVL